MLLLRKEIVVDTAGGRCVWFRIDVDDASAATAPLLLQRGDGVSAGRGVTSGKGQEQAR